MVVLDPHSSRGDVAAPVRVLHVLGYAGARRRRSGITGVERVVESLLHGLGPGFEQTVVYPPAGLMQARFRQRAAHLVVAEPRTQFDRGFLHTLAAALRERRIDVVISHGSRYDFHAALAARRAGVPHLVSRAVALADEEFPRLRGHVYRLADAWTLRGARGIIAVSQASKQRMLATQRLSPQRIEVIPNGVEVPPVDAAERAAARQAFGASGDAFVVGGVGQLIERKSFHLLVEAAARLTGVPPVVVALVGDGPERERLLALARERGVQVELTGFQERPHPFIAAFDVAVLPSRAEGMPLVLLESMALGIACVATPAAGSAEVIEDGVSGLLVPFDDIAALAAALGRLRADPTLRARLSAAGAARIAAQFSPAAMWARWGEVLRTAAGRAT
jgi:glycosyltransferase involved in cell wall biosynthesis